MVDLYSINQHLRIFHLSSQHW